MFTDGFVGLLTISNFFRESNMTESNTFANNEKLNIAIEYANKNKVYSDCDLSYLLRYTNLDKNDIKYISGEFINSNMFIYECMLIPFNSKYGILLLKNQNFFVILYNNNDNKYRLIDLHNNTEYIYDSIENLKTKLNEKNSDIFDDECLINAPIEYIKITSVFEIKNTESIESICTRKYKFKPQINRQIETVLSVDNIQSNIMDIINVSDDETINTASTV
jgi:hypothetical protein